MESNFVRGPEIVIAEVRDGLMTCPTCGQTFGRPTGEAPIEFGVAATPENVAARKMLDEAREHWQQKHAPPPPSREMPVRNR